ncbi:MAG TPA: VCBS repeat-containing protein, partial [Thermoanaerobaculia bacterium]
GTFNAEVTYDTMANPFAIFVADFNADGKPDLAMASDAGFVAVLPGNGDGTFGTVLLSPAGSQQLSLAAADLDGDGNLDLMVVDSDGDKVTTLLGAATEDSHLDRQRRPPGTDRARLRSATLTAMGKPMWW